MKKTDKLCVIIDGSGYLFRAYHAMPPLSNAQGMPTGAIYGVANMLKKYITHTSFSHIVVVFDPKGPTTRHQIDPQYKANRPPMPDALRIQIPFLHDLLRAMGLPIMQIDGIEADDVIGSLAAKAQTQGMHSHIITTDKDMAQLVNDHVTLHNTMTNVKLDSAGVHKKFGVLPTQMVDYLALIGDSVDNIPGIPGVGPKTAAKWLNQYGNLDNIIAHADTIKGKVGAHLRTHLPQLEQARRLVRIDCSIPLPAQWETLKLGQPNTAQLAAQHHILGFDSALSTRTASAAHNTALAASPCAPLRITTFNALQTWLTHSKKSPQTVCLLSLLPLPKTPETPAEENTTPRPLYNTHQPAWQGVAMARKQGENRQLGYCVFSDKLSVAQFSHALHHRYTLTDTTPPPHCLFYALKPVLHTVLAHTPPWPQHAWDKMADLHLMAHVVNSTQPLGLLALAEHYLPATHPQRMALHAFSEKAVLKKKTPLGQWQHLPETEQIDYFCLCASLMIALYSPLSQALQAIPAHHRIYRTIECPLVPVLRQMENTGVCVDVPLLKAQSAHLAQRLQHTAQAVYARVSSPFNLNSTKQLRHVLFSELNLPVKHKTPKGQPSTSESSLHALETAHPIVPLILSHRTDNKLKCTYTDPLPLHRHPHTGRIHCHYHHTMTSTGRLSSSQPNLQNIPIRTEIGRQIRQAFIAPQGYTLIAADYSQIELRIMAHLSQDAALLHAFSQGEDIHKTTASDIFSVPLKSVTALQRRQAKAINFGLIYGMSAFGLAKQLGLSLGTAREYIATYFSRYPGVAAYMAMIKEHVKKQGWVETLHGRRLYFPDIHASKTTHRQYAERAAINAPMQGSAAEIIKRAMIRIHHSLSTQAWEARMIMQVHDELVFEVALKHAQACMHCIEEHMSQAVALSVPLVVTIGQSTHWEGAH